MLRLQNMSILIVILSLTVSACSASLNEIAPSDTNNQLSSEPMGNAVSNTDPTISQRFRTLDEYLNHLELTQGPVDGPWYKQIGPDLYELQTGNLKLDVPAGADLKKVFTRRELERKFGFSK